MQDFAYGRAGDAASAVRTASTQPAVAYLAGGTSLVDLMKEGVEHPHALIDLAGLPLAGIHMVGDTLRLGALATNADVAHHAAVVSRYPLLSLALLSGASPQLRNMATVGGNLLQRTRCPYFRDTGFERCNKRQPGSGCGAREGFHRTQAILGVSSHCIATHPSDMAVALTALDAVVQLQGPRGLRELPITKLYRQPGDHPELEHHLERGELILAVALPHLPFATRSTYVKVRDRASFEFALASAAVALDVAEGRIREARIALGGVGTVPWRAYHAEQALKGQIPTREAFEHAADAELAGAHALPQNAFKVPLARRTMVRALEQLTAAGGRA